MCGRMDEYVLLLVLYFGDEMVGLGVGLLKVLLLCLGRVIVMESICIEANFGAFGDGFASFVYCELGLEDSLHIDDPTFAGVATVGGINDKFYSMKTFISNYVSQTD